MSARRGFFIVAKLIFAGVIFAWLLQKSDVARVWLSVREARIGPIVIGTLICLSTVAIAGWRWQKLLAAIKLPVPLLTTVAIAQIGQFFMVFLPGPTGDDLTRMLYISRIAKGRVGDACATVLLDRVIGLASVLGVALLCIPWQWGLLATSRAAFILACGMVVAGAAVCCGAAAFFCLNQKHLESIRIRVLASLPDGKVRRRLDSLGEFFAVNRLAVARVIAAATATQLLLCIVYWLAGRSVGISEPLSTWLSFVPIVLAANAVPISIAGLGVREYLLVLFLGVLGHVSSDQALAASLVVLAMTLAVCLLGGLAYIACRPSFMGNAAPHPLTSSNASTPY